MQNLALRVFRRPALLIAVAAAAFALSSTVSLTRPVDAHAIIMGVEANGELANPGVTPQQQLAGFNRLTAQGVGLLRVNVSWKAIASGCGDQSVSAQRNPDNACYDWRVYDNVVRLAAERQVKLLFSVSHAPFWLQHSVSDAFVGRSSAQWSRTVAYYPAFMAAIATRYGAGSEYGAVNLWTIWNEPNSVTFWQPLGNKTEMALAPTRYAILYAAGAKAVKAANRAAVVAPGPTGPNSKPIKPVTFIKAFQKVVPRYLPGRTITQKRYYLGAWAHNPYPWVFAPSGSPSLGYRSYGHPEALGMAETDELLRLLDSAPITRGINVWATEFGWETVPPETRELGVSLGLQARYIPEAYDLLDRMRRVTIGVAYVLTDPPNDTVSGSDFQSGTFFNSGVAKPSFYAYQRMISTNATSARRGAVISVYAKANTEPHATRINYSVDGVHWRLLPLTGTNRRRVDGSIRASVRVTRTLRFATWDGVKRGPSRTVVVR
ncbi:MAG: hypothetical protein JWN72_863 [Thermoleophilia bacterium]|nr:hypothetical protein [Thermoleophilia bacterium]